MRCLCLADPPLCFAACQALNDEEKSIDLELAMETILRAFVAQYRDDLAAVTSMFRCDNVAPAAS